MLKPEKEEGNIEYKRLISNNIRRLEALASQMKWRLTEGNGECYYYIGIEDNGTISKLNRILFIIVAVVAFIMNLNAFIYLIPVFIYEIFLQDIHCRKVKFDEK